MDHQTKNYNFPVEAITEAALGENHNLTKQLKLIGHNKRVVDFGCSTGYFAKLLNDRGCVTTGVEINPEAAEVAKRYCDEVVVADLDFVSVKDILPNHEFDAVVFGDVLEHLRNPWRVLTETVDLLKPDGRVIACIPNVAHGAVRLSLLQGRFDYARIGILDDTHLRFFTRRTIGELFEKCGFKIEVLDRVRVPVFSGSPMVPPVVKEHFPEPLIQFIMKAEDADTVQFVVQAAPSKAER